VRHQVEIMRRQDVGQNRAQSGRVFRKRAFTRFCKFGVTQTSTVGRAETGDDQTNASKIEFSPLDSINISNYS